MPQSWLRSSGTRQRNCPYKARDRLCLSPTTRNEVLCSELYQSRKCGLLPDFACVAAHAADSCMEHYVTTLSRDQTRVLFGE